MAEPAGIRHWGRPEQVGKGLHYQDKELGHHPKKSNELPKVLSQGTTLSHQYSGR